MVRRKRESEAARDAATESVSRHKMHRITSTADGESQISLLNDTPPSPSAQVAVGGGKVRRESSILRQDLADMVADLENSKPAREEQQRREHELRETREAILEEEAAEKRHGSQNTAESDAFDGVRSGVALESGSSSLGVPRQQHDSKPHRLSQIEAESLAEAIGTKLVISA